MGFDLGDIAKAAEKAAAKAAAKAEAATEAAAKATAEATAKAEAATEAAAKAAAEATAKATAKAAADAAAEAAAAEAAAKAAAEAAAKAAAEAAAKAADEAATEAAAEAATEAAVDAAVKTAVDEVAQKGASAVVQQVTKSTVLISVIVGLIDNVVKIVEAEEDGSKVKNALVAMRKGMTDAQSNMHDWNNKITNAVKANKLQEMENAGPGLELTLGNLFSAVMNAKTEEFLDNMKPSFIKITAASKGKKKDMEKIMNATKNAKADYISNGNEFYETLKTWDAKDTAIKTEAGIDFKLQEFKENLDAVKNASL